MRKASTMTRHRRGSGRAPISTSTAIHGFDAGRNFGFDGAPASAARLIRHESPEPGGVGGAERGGAAGYARALDVVKPHLDRPQTQSRESGKRAG